jgi:hypothetical protein
MERAMSEFSFFTEASARTFRSAAAVIVPEDSGSPGGAADDVIQIADRMFARRPAADRKLFATFLRVLEGLPLLRYGRPFSRLSLDQRAAVLGWFENNRVARLRQGFFGVKTFVLMGYYGSPSRFEELGYPGPRSDAPYYQLGREPS